MGALAALHTLSRSVVEGGGTTTDRDSVWGTHLVAILQPVLRYREGDVCGYLAKLHSVLGAFLIFTLAGKASERGHQSQYRYCHDCQGR